MYILLRIACLILTANKASEYNSSTRFADLIASVFADISSFCLIRPEEPWTEVHNTV